MKSIIVRLIWFLLGAIAVAVPAFLIVPSGPPAPLVLPRDAIWLPSNIGQLREGALTSLYPVSFEKVPAPLPVGRAGAIASEDGLTLLITREGDLHTLGADGFEKLEIAPPFDIAAQENGLEIARIRRRMGVHDLIMRRRSEEWDLFASHPVHDAETKCLRLRISAITLPDAALRPGGTSSATWRPVYTSEPCLDTSVFQAVMLGGGAMALTSETTLVVGVGTFALQDPDDLGKTLSFLRSPTNHYGKLVEVNLTDGSARVFASGLRDPNGVVPEGDGTFWTTEHGPRGGDELNHVREGLDYGWPLSTYGTDYGRFDWPLDKVPGRHSRFEPPAFAWVPAVALSTAIRIEGTGFPGWKGDLMLASLKATHLYRVRLRGDRVALVEPILIGDRIRDIAETATGDILVLLDRHPHVIRITKAAADSDAMRATTIGFCAGCHQVVSRDTAAHPGPSLVGLIGRPVAGDPNYEYSEALRAIGGTWTPDRLGAFIENPQRFASGTTMPDVDLAPFRLIDTVNWFRDRADRPDGGGQ